MFSSQLNFGNIEHPSEQKVMMIHIFENSNSFQQYGN